MNNQTRVMISLSLFGALAGLAHFAIVEWFAVIQGSDWLSLAMLVFAHSFFGSVLAMAGPIPLVRCLFPAALFSLLLTALDVGASFRFEKIVSFLVSGHPIYSGIILFIIGIAFLIVGIQTHKWPREYPALFDAAWGVVTRVFTSCAFTGVFWLLLLLSNLLLELVGIPIIKEFIEIDVVPWIVSGAVFGLAIAVVHDLSDFISPQLFLRLLRLLMPMITIVVLIFVCALPFRGLSNLFGTLSAGSLVMGMGLVATVLVSAAIDRNSEQGVQRPLMRLSVQILACLVPVLGALAIAAVWIRVQDYGWTPDRIIAAIIACILFAYGLVYAVAILQRTNWDHRMRQGNVALALGVMVIVALWHTPLLNPQAISARSQVARLDQGTELNKLPLFEMAHEWGHAGRSELKALKTRYSTEDDTKNHNLITIAETAKYQWEFTEKNRDTRTAELLSKLDKTLLVFPNDSPLPSEIFGDIKIRDPHLFNPCLNVEPQTTANCILINVPQSPSNAAHFVLITELSGPFQGLWAVEKNESLRAYKSDSIQLSQAAKDDLLAGKYTIAPPKWSSVQLQGEELFLAPWE